MVWTALIWLRMKTSERQIAGLGMMAMLVPNHKQKIYADI
jgi:hypothetical protein